MKSCCFKCKFANCIFIHWCLTYKVSQLEFQIFGGFFCSVYKTKYLDRHFLFAVCILKSFWIVIETAIGQYLREIIFSHKYLKERMILLVPQTASEHLWILILWIRRTSRPLTLKAALKLLIRFLCSWWTLYVRHYGFYTEALLMKGSSLANCMANWIQTESHLFRRQFSRRLCGFWVVPLESCTKLQ